MKCVKNTIKVETFVLLALFFSCIFCSSLRSEYFFMFFFSDERMFSSRWMNYSNNTIKVEAFCSSCEFFLLLSIWILFYVIFLWWMNAFCQMDERVEEHNKGRNFCSSRGSFLLLPDLNNFLCFFFSNECMFSKRWMNCSRTQ